MTPVKRVSITRDHVSEVVRSITSLVRKQVLVGIPDSSTDREHTVSGDVTNAALGYLHETGSPAANIPARPFLVPGVQAAETKSVAQLQKAAEATMRGDTRQAEAHLQTAGMIAETSVKNVLTNGDFEPLKPATIRARRYSRQTQSMRQSERQYLDLVKGGMDSAAAQEAVGIRPLINTGQLRNAVTHVIREK